MINSGVVRAILLAHVDSLSAEDEDLLLKIWNHGIEEQRLYPVQIRIGRAKGTVEVRLNVQATAASYALGKHGRTDMLLGLWQDTSWDDPQLKGELAVALALTGDPAVVPAVQEYVQRAWKPPYEFEAIYDLEYRRRIILGFLHDV